MKQLLLTLVLGFCLYYHGYRITKENGLYYVYFHFTGETQEHLVTGFGSKTLAEAERLVDSVE